MTIAVQTIPPRELKPETKADIYQALIAAQGEFKPIPKTKKVNFGNVKYSYADFDDLVQCVRPILCKNSLAFVHRINTELDHTTFMECEILHKSGQSIGCKLEIKLPDDPKQAGGIITYFKRYTLEAMLGVTTNEDTDATVQEAPKSVGRETKPPAAKSKASGAKSSTITEAQRKRLFAIAGEKKLGKEQMEPLLKGFGFDSSKDDTKAAYEKVIAAIESYDSASS